MKLKIIAYVIVVAVVITGCHEKTAREKELAVAVAMNNQENIAPPAPIQVPSQTQVATPASQPKPCKPSTTDSQGIPVFSGCLKQ